MLVEPVTGHEAADSSDRPLFSETNVLNASQPHREPS
jgi:hypothetical protein